MQRQGRHPERPASRLHEGAAKLDYSYRVATLNIDPDKYDPNLIGYSGMGDQTGAKQGTMRTYLQDASDAGAKLLTNTWVQRILTKHGAAVGVEATYTDPRTQQNSRVVTTPLPSWLPPAPWRSWASPPVGHRRDRRRRRTATTPRQPRHRNL